MIELKVFQSKSSKLIADRYGFFANHPERPSKGQLPRPFFQALSALTGAGKTPILADAVTRIRAHLGAEPIVLWMSKARSVIGQTYGNFSLGGKYSHLIEDFRTARISDLTPSLLTDISAPLLITTTTGLFNNKEQAEGNLQIYKIDKDKFGEQSLWERLISREAEGVRRPLIVVYDEGHNLSEQQAEIISELEPDGYLLASATLRLPENFTKSVVNPIRLWVEEAGNPEEFSAVEALAGDETPSPDLFVTTTVDSAAVVKAELVKLALQFDGTTAAMDRAIDELFERRELLTKAIEDEAADLVPKAIYVCKTNITDEGTQDDPTLPFSKRQAPPIRIWRYLVENKGVNPADIAIYANLRFEKGAKPDELNLFSKGESDFDEFTSADYEHIIFNLSLQEGWDDPSCYLAYIDKSMGSTIQVEQIMGRVLRQPKVRHYQSPLLNTAHFFVRVDRESVFSETLERVKAKLKTEGAPLTVTSNFGGKGKASESVDPKAANDCELHHIFVDSEAARKKIDEIVEDYPIFSEGDPNTVAEARTASATVQVAGSSGADGNVKWSVSGYTNPVRLRWFVHTALKARSSRALAIADLTHQKFDVRVQVQSKAAKLAESLAENVTKAFYSLAELVYESSAPFVFGPIRVGKGAIDFSNALYPRYSGFNKFELPFANSLDEAGLHWHRNPVAGGFFIPLLSEGDTTKFYPDFLVWKNGLVYCLDTKGSHLLTDAVARKLFDIQEDKHTKVLTRFISEGKQEKLQGSCKKGGYTVWKLKNGNPTPSHFDTLKETIEDCLQ